METKLFFISLITLAYTLCLKYYLKLKKFPYRKELHVYILLLFHIIFYSVLGLILGMVFSTMSNNPESINRFSFIGACAGAIFGFLHFISKNNEEKRMKAIKSDLEWADTSWSAILLASLLMFFVIQAFKIPSGSMRMTLIEGDHLFVNKFIYGIHIPFSNGKRILEFKKVKHKDIVIFSAPESALSKTEKEKGIKKDFIKRAIGLPGDKIQIINKKVYVNDVLLDEKDTSGRIYVRFEDDPYTYPEMKIFKTQQEYQSVWEKGGFVNLPVRDNFGPVIVPPKHYFVLGDNRDRSFDSRFWGPLPDRLLKGQALIIYWPPNRIKIIK